MKYAEAARYYQEALAMREALNDRRGMASTLHNIGHILAAQKKHDQALTYYEKALRISRALEHRSLIGLSLNGVGMAHLRLGHPAEAVEAFRQALALAEEIQALDVIWLTRYHLGLGYQALGRAAEALPYYQSAVEAVEKVRASASSTEGKIGFLADRMYIYEDLIRLLYKQMAAEPSADYGRQAFAVAERSKARALFDLLAEAKIDPQSRLPAAWREKKRQLQVQWAAAQRSLLREYERKPADKQKIQGLEAARDRIDADYAALIAEVRRLDPHYSYLQYPEPLSLEAVQALLDDRTLLLEYALGQEASFLFAVTRTDFRIYRLPDGRMAC